MHKLSCWFVQWPSHRNLISYDNRIYIFKRPRGAWLFFGRWPLERSFSSSSAHQRVLAKRSNQDHLIGWLQFFTVLFIECSGPWLFLGSSSPALVATVVSFLLKKIIPSSIGCDSVSMLNNGISFRKDLSMDSYRGMVFCHWVEWPTASTSSSSTWFIYIMAWLPSKYSSVLLISC